jgi:hypothetical protein
LVTLISLSTSARAGITAESSGLLSDMAQG